MLRRNTAKSKSTFFSKEMPKLPNQKLEFFCREGRAEF